MARYTLYPAVIVAILVSLFAGPAAAADVSLEKDMQQALVAARAIVKRMQAGLDAQHGIGPELARLKTLAADIRVNHLLLTERYQRRQERLDALSPKAGLRHRQMVAAYRAVVQAFLAVVDELPTADDVTPDVLENLSTLLKDAPAAKKRPIFGSLPYRHLNLASKAPLAAPTITPAYKGGNKTVSAADTQSSAAAPITAEIAALAQSLDWNPVRIYEWVKNNIETQWYWGVMKGAVETLRQKSGNDADQAALLVALLRAAGYPSRFVQGVIEFYPDLAVAKNLTGVADERELAAFFQNAGIAYRPLLGQGTIVNFQIAHIWVETQVPYANYRGAVIDEYGKSWLGLDTSIKTAGYLVGEPPPLLDEIGLAEIRSNYLASLREETVLEFMRTEIDAYLDQNRPGTSYDDLLRSRDLVAETLNILPAALQFKQVAITGEFTELPAELFHQARFAARDAEGTVLFDITRDTFSLSNRKIILAYEPDTVEDQEIINSYGGLSNTPSYLVRLRPVLKVDDERLAVGADGLPVGETYRLSLELIAPHASQVVENEHIVGNLAAVGLVAQDAVAPEPIDAEQADAERILYEAALDYIDQWNLAEAELAALLQLGLTRPIATAVTLGGVIEVTPLFDTPHGFEWQGVFVDADLRAVEIAGGTELGAGIDPALLFMQLSGMQGSVLESRTLADHFQVESISTAGVLGLADTTGIPIVIIDTDSVDSLLPTLPFGDYIKDDIRDAVNQGFVVTIPVAEIDFEDWTGIGYLKEQPATGESGWMLSGMIAGGMTVWGADRWSQYYFERLVNPYAEPPNFDPASALFIQKLTVTDLQQGTAGQALTTPLQVIVKDDQDRPVSGTEVVFSVRAGGGRLGGGSNTLTASTDFNGIASAPFTLGQRTADNPTLWWEPGFTFSQQVGENIIDAALASGTSIKAPFVAYGMPGEPAAVRKTHGDDKFGDVLTWRGFIKVMVEDSFGNPVANQPVNFAVQAPVEQSSCSNANQDSRPGLVFKLADSCMDTIPNYGDCSSAATSLEVTSDHKGAAVYIMTGGTPAADYDITAGSGGLSTTFTMHTYPFGNCGGNSSPDMRFWLSTIFFADSFGNNINAAKPGDTIPLMAKMSFTREKELEEDYTFECDGSQRTCTRIVGGRQYFRDTDFAGASLSFGSVGGSAQGGGVFTAEYPVQPGINDIRIDGEAAVGYRQSILTCDECSIEDRELTRQSNTTLRVYGVQVQIDTTGAEIPNTIIIPLDDSGFARCDTRIDFTITPSEYQADSAYMIIYKDGAAINYIPTEIQGAGFATLSQGYQFDLASNYEAEVVLNYGGAVEIRSERVSLGAGDVRIESIYIEDGYVKLPIPPGETARAKAVTVPAGRRLKWTIEGRDEGVLATIHPVRGVIEADENTEAGWITVRATDTRLACVYKDVRVFIGCEECERDGNYCKDIEGGGFLELASIDFRTSLGKAEFGQSAGDLYLRADEPSRELATPAALAFSSLVRGIDVVYTPDEVLRQVLAPKTVVDIAVIDDFSYDILFYSATAVTGQTDGVYDLDPAAEPFVVWRIENPDAAVAYNRLKITEIRGGTNTVSEYLWDENLSAWSLNNGNGLQITTRAVAETGDDRIVVETLKDRDGNIASQTRLTLHRYPWGEELVERVVDPDGAALTTTRTFYEDPDAAGSYGRIKDQIDADGSWVRYQYDESGRKILEVRPWLDTAADAPADNARAISYDYAPVDPLDGNATDDERLPRTVTETVLGIVTAKTYYAYLTDGDGSRVEVVEQGLDPAADYGAAGNLRTETVYYPSGTDRVESGRLKSIRHPGGRLDTYLYEAGTFTPAADPTLSVFTPGAGSALRETITHGTVDAPEGVAFKTTRETSIQDEFGQSVLEETYVYDGDAFARIQWTANFYDEFNRLIRTAQSDGTQTESSWSCCNKLTDTDSRGIIRTYKYDDLKRLASETKAGFDPAAWPAQSDVVTTYTYDAADRRLTETRSADGLSLVKRNVYDAAGRLIRSVDEAGLVTTFEFDAGGRVTTVTRPGGATGVTTLFADGRTQSITGTNVIPQYLEYGINPDGSQWTKVYAGSPDSTMWEKTTVDLLSRPMRVEKPGFSGLEVSENFYDSTGLVIKTTTSGEADTLYVYDSLDHQIRSGLDVDDNGILEPASNDRISESDTAFAGIDGAWWQQTVSRVYAGEGDGNPTTTGSQRIRLTGMGAGGVTEESILTDIHGNVTANQVVIDRDRKTVSRITDFPDSDIDEIAIGVNGRQMSMQSKTGVVITFAYDALGRQTGVVDPRTGSTLTHYNAKGQVDYTEDPAGNRTQHTYDPDSGFKVSETNALGKTTRFAYDVRGQIVRIWGDVPYPVQYEYDIFGRMIRMQTYRAESGWDGPGWPQNPGPGDTTRWQYQEATGLLIAKEDARGQAVGYTYTTQGRLASRTWARRVDDQPLATTYSYDPATGELTRIDYADATPDVEFSYDRLGRRKTVTDAVGVRSFAYDASLQLQSETNTGLYDHVITHVYETAGLPGRAAGFTLGPDYSVNYGYDAVGRIDSVGWNVNGESHAADYAYLPDTNMLRQLTIAGGPRTTYAYEPKRDLRSGVKNEFNANVVSQYDYTFDALGRRTLALNGGQAFAAVTNAFNRYEYNARNELVESTRYLGADITDLASPVQSEYRNYTYDPIGNRTAATGWNAAADSALTATYKSDALNQYFEITTDDGQLTRSSLDYDPDGNLVLAEAAGKSMNYAYDAENRLIAAEPRNPAESDTRVELRYDYLGRRVEKQVFRYTAGAWLLETQHRFLFDNWNAIVETVNQGPQEISEFYVWGLDLNGTLHATGGVGGLLWMKTGGDPAGYYVCYDGHGNVTQLLDANVGSIAAHYAYDPYGNLITAAGAAAGENPYRYSTKYFESAMDLYYFGKRFYSAMQGRWLSRDPAGELGGVNLYIYVENSPVNKIDVIGLTSLTAVQQNITFYTWHMGWIDKSHAYSPSRSLQEAWDKVKDAKDGKIVSFSLTMKQTFKRSTAEFCLRVKGDQMNRKNQLLYAWMVISNQFESYQGEGLQGNAFINKLYGLFTGEKDKIPSSFSTEDLVSNLVNFYSVVDATKASDLIDRHAGKFDQRDEVLISTAIWVFSLKPRPGYRQWRPQYFDHEEFMKFDFDLSKNTFYPISKEFNVIAAEAQKRLPKYISKFGEPRFPRYFQKYRAVEDGYISIKKEND